MVCKGVSRTTTSRTAAKRKPGIVQIRQALASMLARLKGGDYGQDMTEARIRKFSAQLVGLQELESQSLRLVRLNRSFLSEELVRKCDDQYDDIQRMMIESVTCIGRVLDLSLMRDKMSRRIRTYERTLRAIKKLK